MSIMKKISALTKYSLKRHYLYLFKKRGVNRSDNIRAEKKIKLKYQIKEKYVLYSHELRKYRKQK